MPDASQPTRLRAFARQLILGSTLAVVGLLAPATFAQDAAPDNRRLEELFAGGTPATVVELKAMQQHQQELAEKVIPCTVGIRIGPVQGSGVIVSEDGVVLTAGHVSGKANRRVEIILHDGRVVRGKTLGANNGIDSGMIKITDEGPWPHVKLGTSADLERGQWVLATGHPNGYQKGRTPPVRVGRILRNGPAGVQTDCTLVGGDSGGPLFDMKGRVIGIHSRIGNSLSANIHVPVDTYPATWDRLAAGEIWDSGDEGRAFLGVRADTESDAAAVESVEPEGPAAKAGLKAGDIITRIDDRKIDSFQELALTVFNRRPGETVTLQVRRGDEVIELSVKLGRMGEQ